MNKVILFFNKRGKNEEHDESNFPELTPREEQEVLEELGVVPQPNQRAKDVIMGTLRKHNNYSPKKGSFFYLKAN